MFRKGHRVGEVKKWETDLRALKKKRWVNMIRIHYMKISKELVINTKLSELKHKHTSNIV